jgi:hypothetical protein
VRKFSRQKVRVFACSGRTMAYDLRGNQPKGSCLDFFLQTELAT